MRAVGLSCSQNKLPLM